MAEQEQEGQSQDTAVGGEGNDAAKQQAETEMQRKLGESNEKLAAAQVYAQLMRDPDFAAVAQAKAAGKKIKVEIDNGQVASLADRFAPKPEAGATVNYEKMTNEELAKHGLHQTATMVEAMLNEKLQPLVDSLQGVAKTTQKQENERARAEIEQTRQEFADFDTHRTRMMELAAEFPTAKAEQLYVLAKTEKGEAIVRKRSLQSERPSSIVGRPSSHSTRKTPLPIGKLGMQQLLAEAGEKLRTSGILNGLEGDED